MSTIEPSIQHLDFDPEPPAPSAPKVHYIAPGEWGDENYLIKRAHEHTQRQIATVMGLPAHMLVPSPEPLPYQWREDRLMRERPTMADRGYELAYCSPSRGLFLVPPSTRGLSLRNWIGILSLSALAIFLVAGFFVG